MHLFESWFDDLEPGMAFTSRGRTVTEADVVAFAAQTGDFHPQHVDARWAAGGPFGERIAHGMLVLAYAAGLVPLDPERVMALRRVKDATFKRPVRLGDTIRVSGRVASLAGIDARSGLVAVALDVTGRGDRTVMRATIDLLWRREEAPVPVEEPEIETTGFIHAFSSVPF